MAQAVIPHGNIECQEKASSLILLWLDAVANGMEIPERYAEALKVGNNAVCKSVFFKKSANAGRN